MKVVIGQGDHRYEVEPRWGQLPDGHVLGDVAGVAVDSRDRLYAFTRGDHPVVIFESDGSYVGTWGEGIFTHPHGILITAQDEVFCTDDGDHTVRKFTLDGELLLQIGTPGSPSGFMSGDPFRRCTQAAVAAGGDIFVSDGYGNNRIHRFRPDGTFVTSFGYSGSRPGEFNFPHHVAYFEGRLYVSDRENHRVQIFGEDGDFISEWHGLHMPTAVVRGLDCWFVGENGPMQALNRGAPNLGPRISLVDDDGTLITRLGIEPAAGTSPGQFLSPHDLAVDSVGDIYVAQVSNNAWPRLFPDLPIPDDLSTLQKLTRIRTDDKNGVTNV